MEKSTHHRQEKLLTYEEWYTLGYSVKFNERPKAKNEKKKGLFDLDQVVKRTYNEEY